MIVPTDPDRSTFKNQVQHLDLAYDEAVRYAEEIRPYWLSLREPRDDALQWALFDYFPAAHYKWACHRSADNIETDGGFDELDRGKQRATVYYWLDPQTGAALHHTGVNDGESVPFFPDEGMLGITWRTVQRSVARSSIVGCHCMRRGPGRWLTPLTSSRTRPGLTTSCPIAGYEPNQTAGRRAGIRTFGVDGPLRVDCGVAHTRLVPRWSGTARYGRLDGRTPNRTASKEERTLDRVLGASLQRRSTP